MRMQRNTELRQALCSARHWERALCERAAALRNQSPSSEVAEPTRALAAALEAAVLDRRHAIEMYLLASKASREHADALARARALAREIGDLKLAARIAASERKRTKNAGLALVEGEAWLDAGDPDRAIRPLLAALQAFPGEAQAERALAAARREWADVRAELDRLQSEAAAATEDAEAARDLLQGWRIAHMLGEPDRARELLGLAFSRDPQNESVCALIERELVRAGDWNGLLESCRRRADAAASPRDVVEALRRAATRMSVTDGAPGLAVQVALRALGYAYDHGVADIPGHLALLDILCRHYLRVRSPAKLLPVIDRGLGAPLPEDDALALAILGLDVAWTHLGSAATAQPYAERVEPLAPGHPVLAAYQRGGGGAARMSPASEDEGSIVPDELELVEEPGAEPHSGASDAPAPEAGAPELAARERSERIEMASVAAEEEDPVPSPSSGEKARSPVPPQGTPPAPELEEMIELDPGELEELGDEDSSEGLDTSTVVDPGEGATTATGPHRAPSHGAAQPPPAPPKAGEREAASSPSPRGAASEKGRAPSSAALPGTSPKAPPSSRDSAAARPARGGAGSLIPGSAKKALEQVVGGPAPPPVRGPEKRADERVALSADASLSLSARVVLGDGARAVTRDLSPSGAFIVTDASLPQDVAFELTLALPSPDAARLREHALRAVVVREEPGVGYGLRFEHPSPEFQQAVSDLYGRDRD